jgi:DNA polymerase-3 subunit gamma/tau
MSYQVLARKWRPHTFKEMVGQEHVLRMLMNALDKQRLHHAYLFTGTRGVGKTTLARLLAKCLNCESGITSTPCGTCSACNSIDSGRFLDLLEIDAASRTKVEDTRELLDNVQYAPTQGRFKIYLIDEVHMLSGHSFNALLKTLEEPPAHVKFILATTDPKKLPITILSRCLQFNLKRVPYEQIAKQLQHICESEKISAQFPALQLLSHAADGSMRDSLSLLDQAIAFCEDSITVDDTQRMLGHVEREAIIRLLEALAEKNAPSLFSEITSLAESAPDFQHVLESVLGMLHQVAIQQALNLAEADASIVKLANQLSPEDTQLYYQIALIGKRDLSLAPSPTQGFEMVMLRMLAFHPATAAAISAPVTNKATIIPKRVSQPTVAPSKPPATKPVLTATATPLELTEITSDTWSELLPKLGITGMAHALAANCAFVEIDNQSLVLALSHKHEPMLNPKILSRLEEAITAHFNKLIKLTIKISSDNLNTAAKKHEQTKQERHAHAVESITTDDHVQKIMDVFGATLDVSSVQVIEPPK